MAMITILTLTARENRFGFFMLFHTPRSLTSFLKSGINVSDGTISYDKAIFEGCTRGSFCLHYAVYTF